MKKVYSVIGELEIFQMEAPWTYISVPENKIPNVKPGGWGSIPVNVTVGKTTWKTSIFPIQKGAGHFIPIKKQVRNKESIVVGDTFTVKYSAA